MKKSTNANPTKINPKQSNLRGTTPHNGGISYNACIAQMKIKLRSFRLGLIFVNFFEKKRDIILKTFKTARWSSG